MKLLILIPSYLSKNTFKKWCENPISPLSKVIITLLLTLLSILVLVFFAEAKNQLLNQLKKSNSYTIYISEQIGSKTSPQLLRKSYDEENLWYENFSPEHITYIRQPFMFTKDSKGKSIPVIIFNQSLPHLRQTKNNYPTAWLLSKSPVDITRKEEVFIDGVSMFVTPAKMPEVLSTNINLEQAIAIPIEMAEPILTKGFTTHIIASLESAEQVEQFTSITSAYYKAEKRRTLSFSALEILTAIKQLSALQNKIRIGIVLITGFILATILGTIAWLEFRQEAYLLALLRTFGSPRFLLLIHSLLENLFLIAIAIAIAFKSWQPIYTSITNVTKNPNFSDVSQIPLQQEDIAIIILAATTGVILAIIPIIFGLKKQPGLILQ